MENLAPSKEIESAFARYGFEPLSIENIGNCRIGQAVKLAVSKRLFEMVEAIVTFGNQKSSETITKTARVCIGIGHGMTACVSVYNCLNGTYGIGDDIFVHHHDIVRKHLPKKQARDNSVSIRIGDTNVFSATQGPKGINKLSIIIGTTPEAKKAFRAVQRQFNEIASTGNAHKNQQS